MSDKDYSNDEIVLSISRGIDLKAPLGKKKYKSLYLYRTKGQLPALFKFTDYKKNGEFLVEYRIAISGSPVEFQIFSDLISGCK